MPFGQQNVFMYYVAGSKLIPRQYIKQVSSDEAAQVDERGREPGQRACPEVVLPLGRK